MPVELDLWLTDAFLLTSWANGSASTFYSPLTWACYLAQKIWEEIKGSALWPTSDLSYYIKEVNVLYFTFGTPFQKNFIILSLTSAIKLEGGIKTLHKYITFETTKDFNTVVLPYKNKFRIDHKCNTETMFCNTLSKFLLSHNPLL